MVLWAYSSAVGAKGPGIESPLKKKKKKKKNDKEKQRKAHKYKRTNKGAVEKRSEVVQN